jgi:hypothetical protein
MEKEKRKKEKSSYDELRLLRKLDRKLCKIELTKDERDELELLFELRIDDLKSQIYGLE